MLIYQSSKDEVVPGKTIIQPPIFGVYDDVSPGRCGPQLDVRESAASSAAMLQLHAESYVNSESHPHLSIVTMLSLYRIMFGDMCFFRGNSIMYCI